MIGPDLLSRVTAQAATPEQLVPYVCAVSGAEPRLIGNCVGFDAAGEFVLVGYPLHDPRDTGAMAEAVSEALKIHGLAHITVIGPASPPQAPAGSTVFEDCYYSLSVPPPHPPAQKVRNLIRRASRELTVDRGRNCGDNHLALVQRYLDERHLATGTRHIFQQLPHYLTASSGSLVFSARLSDGRLAGFAVGEFGALSTAFFMFCFREPRLAPPGCADLLLWELLDEAYTRGQTLMNLGLGINEGISFFKRKWGAVPFLPYVQVSWAPARPGLLKRLSSLFSR